MKFKVLVVLMVLGIISATTYATDITGKWVFDMSPPNGGEPIKIFYTFKVDGTNLTGTMGPEGEEREISEGKIDGENISFTVPFGQNGTKMNGKIKGDQIELSFDESVPRQPGFEGDTPPMVLKRVE